METKAVTIILLGDAQDCEISELLRERLHAEMICSNGRHTGIYGVQGRRVYLLESERLSTSLGEETIVVLKKTARDFAYLDSAALVILCSDYKRHLQALDAASLCVATCGLSHKDTVTYSSKGEEKSVVSLQRALHLGERSIDPQEITVDATGEDYAVLAAAVLQLLCR